MFSTQASGVYSKVLLPGQHQIEPILSNMGLRHAFLMAAFVASCVGHCVGSNGEAVLPMH